MFTRDLLQGKRILVTGGGTGLGKEISVGFAAHGAHVFICGRRQDVLDQAVGEIRTRSGGQADAFVANVRDPDSIEAMMAAIWATGPLTGLVNNAGANFLAPTETLSPRGYEAIRSTVMDGSFYAAQGCGKRWIADGSSRRDHQQSRHLGLDRIGLCGAGGDGQGSGACDDDVAGGRMGAERNSRQCGRARSVSDRKCLGQAQSTGGNRLSARHRRTKCRYAASERWMSCAIS